MKMLLFSFKANIKEEKLEEFRMKNSQKVIKFYVPKYQVVSCYAPNVVVRTAISMLNKSGYDLFSNNCEHFAHWCETGKKVSAQVNDVIERVGGMGGELLTGVTVAALLPLEIPVLIFLGVFAAACYAGGKVGGKFTSGLFTESTNYKTA